MNKNVSLNDYEEYDGISIQSLFKIIWNNIMVIIIITCITLAIGIFYTFSIVKPKYKANTSLIVEVDSESSGINEQSGIVIANNLIGTFKEFVLSNTVLESVKADIPELDGVSLTTLKNSISVSTINQVLVFYVSVESTSPELAQNIANTLVTNAIEIANNEDDPYLFLQNKLRLLDSAILPESPSSPNKVVYVFISGFLGVIISIAIIFLKEFFDNKYKTVGDLEKHLNIKVLASVPSTIKGRKSVN
ncbi:MAG: YveK family protein [Candidatus Izemoplasmatales bacterium]